MQGPTTASKAKVESTIEAERRLALRRVANEAHTFRWGSSDCCQFAAAVVYEITGRDLSASFPHYDTPRGAARILKAHDGLIGLVDTVLPRTDTPLVGDLVALPDGVDSRAHLAAYLGGGRALAPAHVGLATVEARHPLCAWTVS